MTGPARAEEEGSSPEALRDSHVTVLVARHFEAMWAHMRQGLDALPASHHRLTEQVDAAAVCHCNLLLTFACHVWLQAVGTRCRDLAQENC